MTVTSIDAHWVGRAIDIQAGDFVLLPSGTLSEGKNVHPVRDDAQGVLYSGVTPGIGRFYHPSTKWAAFVRVSRQGYVGRSIFRHLEEPDND